jgi:hypothetical protein
VLKKKSEEMEEKWILYNRVNMKTMEWIMARLMEPSTWRGIITVLSAAGVSVSPQLIGTVLPIGMAGIGLVEMLKVEK